MSMDASSKLESAKKHCLIVLVLGYTAWFLTLFFYDRSADLNRARQLCAMGWVKINVTEAGPEELPAEMGNLNTTTGIWEMPFGTVVQKSIRSEINKKRQIIYGLDSKDEKGEESKYWGFPQNFDYLAYGVVIEELADLARKHNVPIKKPAAPDFGNIFTEIKNALYKGQIEIPGVSFAKFTPIAAVWVISLGLTTFLVVIDNRLKSVIASSDYGLSEPWLIVDAVDFIERMFAAIWALGIFLAPIVMSMMLMISFVDHYFTVEMDVTWQKRMLVFFYMVFSIWVAVTESFQIIGRIHLLKRLRTQKMAELENDENPPTSPQPQEAG